MDFLKDLSIDKVRNLAEDAFNQAKPKTDVEARVYEVLSHKNWGSSSSLMHEIARDTFDSERFYVITRLLWESMEDQRPAAWRVVFKGLTLLEFLVKNGAERCVDDARNHGHVLRSLGQFNYYEGTIDRGLGVREKSKQLLEILGDDERIREERQKARQLREKFNGAGATAASGGGGAFAGYGNKQDWSGGASGPGGGVNYGQGGIDSPYSGRYGEAERGGGASGPAPTFAAMPAEKKKKKKKKPKSISTEQQQPSAPAPEPVVDLFSFDDPTPAPAPVPAASPTDQFGSFQSTPAPAPAAANDDFAAFAAAKSTQPDPFASTPAPVVQQQQTASFNAFGNNNVGGGVPAGGMANMNDAFGNMNMGGQQQQPMMQQQQPQMTNNMAIPAPSANAGEDDDFGDFSSAAPVAAAPVIKSNDPLAKLVSLDGLSKNPQNQTRNASNQMSFAGIGQTGVGQPNLMNNNPNNNLAAAPVMVSAGGSDAISSMMGPPPPQMQQGMQQGLQPQNVHQQQQQQGGGGMSNQQMMQQQQRQQQMMMQGNMMGGNQMPGGMQQGNMMGANMNMMGGNMQGNMMGGNPNMMGGMQGNMMGGNPNMMGGMQQGNNMNMMGGQQQMGGMPGNNMMGGNMQGNMMGSNMGGQQQWR